MVADPLLIMLQVVRIRAVAVVVVVVQLELASRETALVAEMVVRDFSRQSN